MAEVSLATAAKDLDAEHAAASIGCCHFIGATLPSPPQTGRPAPRKRYGMIRSRRTRGTASLPTLDPTEQQVNAAHRVVRLEATTKMPRQRTLRSVMR
jgi:hypothetical protein